MINFFKKWIISSLAFLLTAWLLPGIVLTGLNIALLVALIWGFVNYFVRPVLHILALPITIMTLGIFYFILNGLLLIFVSKLIDGFEVSGIFTAIIGTLLISFFTSLGNNYVFKQKDEPYFKMKEVK